MNGWDTIKEVRRELSEAKGLACDGHFKTAYACMSHAKNLLVKYCETAKGPDYGFEGDVSKPKGKRS